jgi:hypothetical protein
MHRRRGSRRYLARNLIEHDGNEFVGKLEVGGLEDVIWAIEDDDCIAGDVGLHIRTIIVSFSLITRFQHYQTRTIICLPSQDPVVTAWSLAWGLPGRIARMGAVEGRRWLRRQSLPLTHIQLDARGSRHKRKTAEICGGFNQSWRLPNDHKLRLRILRQGSSKVDAWTTPPDTLKHDYQ